MRPRHQRQLLRHLGALSGAQREGLRERHKQKYPATQNFSPRCGGAGAAVPPQLLVVARADAASS